MSAVSQISPKAVTYYEQELRWRLQSALLKIIKELESSETYDMFTSELRVWAINFSYYLNLDSPSAGLKIYIPLLVECLHKCTRSSHPAYILMNAWLKNPDATPFIPRDETDQNRPVHPAFHVLLHGCQHINFTPLRPETATVAYQWVLPSHRQLLQFWKLRNRVDSPEDLLWAKMGRTDRSFREFIFSFLDRADLNKAAAVCKEFFTRCHSPPVFKAVYLPRFKQTHPDLSKREYSTELNAAAETLRVLMDQAVEDMALFAATTNKHDLLLQIRPVHMGFSKLTIHLVKAQKTFPYEMLFFHAVANRKKPTMTRSS